jgi:hypothetical protein
MEHVNITVMFDPRSLVVAPVVALVLDCSSVMDA